ncbi:MAG: site-specific integrase [Trueperaceae bacterium]|nr:site-specific integrase [Trueperaceae bacterium]
MSNRRDKGRGYVGKKADSKGRFKGYLTIGYTEEGKPIRIYRTAKTRAELKRLIDALVEEHNRVSNTNDDSTLAQYLETWLGLKEQELKPKSYRNYKRLIHNHLIPRLGKVKLGQLVPLDTQVILRDIAKQHGGRTSNYARSVLLSALNRAVELGIIEKNPLVVVRKVKEEKRQPVIWTAEEMLRFLEVAEKHRLYPLFHLAMATGLRHGELLGLQWDDLDDGQIHVQRSVDDQSGKAVVSTPKTENSKRYVALSEDCLQILAEHRLRQAEEKAYLGESWTETGHIFVSELGTLLLQRNVTRVFKTLKKKASIPNAHIHDLRHMHVSLLIDNNIDPRTVADRIGHADPSFTFKTYSHMIKGKQRKTAIPLKTLIGNPEEDESESEK